MHWIDALSQRLLRGTDLQALEHGRKILLFLLLTALGVALLLIFGGVSYANDRMLLAAVLWGAGGLGMLNLVWLLRARQYRQSAIGIAFIVAAVSGLLVTTGGVEGTGLLWIYPLMAIAIFTAGFTVGSFIFGLFFAITLVALFWADTMLLDYVYPEKVKIRFVVSLLCLGIISLAVEFVHSRSRNKMEQLHTEVEQSALSDALTQLPNRRYVSQRVIASGQFLPAYQGGCVVLADIDHFKTVNDHYGHEVGDVVLKSVARFLASETRSDDVVARWGGEEFLLVLPKITASMAERRMEHVRKTLAAMDVVCQGVRIRVTLSFGVTAIGGSETANDVLRRADKNLYLAKEQGRNRIVVS